MFAYLLVLAIFFTSITCLNFVSNSDENPSLQIQLPDGLIQGRAKHTVDTGMPYYSYEGIPYARPPVGALRFKVICIIEKNQQIEVFQSSQLKLISESNGILSDKQVQAPQPPQKWEGILDADGSVPVCYQAPPIPIGNAVESEDCLYLHVYVPKPSPENNQSKAVMVWIYGGAFQLGFARARLYGPDYLIEQDVILVTINYRLNAFGFLATNDMESPGNNGLKDQQAALKWVKNNIRLFGGDSNRITIFGESAGGASVQYHLLSPKSRGLFHAAISQSGAALCHWALQRDPKRMAMHMGNLGGFFGRDTKRLMAFLRKLKANELRDLAMRAMLVDAIMVFLPVLEPEHEDAFITESSYTLLQEKRFTKVPYIIGFNSGETGSEISGLDFFKPVIGVLPISGDMLIPLGLNNKAPKIGEEIKKHYFGDKSKSVSTQYVKFFGDNAFYRPIVESARLYSMVAPTYMYQFAYSGYYLGKKALLSQDRNSNITTHAEELWYIFSRFDLKKANETDKLIRKRMVVLWTNFAKYGNPTPKQNSVLQNVIWPKYRENDYAYLNINRDLTIESNFRGETMEFWRHIFDKYGKPPFYVY